MRRPNNRPPTPEELQALTDGRSAYFMRREFGVNEEIVARWKHDLSHAGERTPEARGACDLPTGAEPEVDDRESWRTMLSTAEAHRKSKQGVDDDHTTFVRNYGDRPVGLFLTSDWHVGSDSVDLDHILRDAELVAQFRRSHPGSLKLFHLGDPIDGYMPGLGAASGGMFETVEPRLDRQEGMFLELARIMSGADFKSTTLDDHERWEALLLGCHEAWTLTKGGRDPITPLAKQLKAVNGGYGLAATITVGEVQYRGIIRHRTRFESNLNTTNAQRWIDNEANLDPFGHRADFVSISHLHNNDLQKRNKSGRQVVYTRSGSYKGGDCFARSINATMHKTADEGSPLLVLLPDRRKVVPFAGPDWREGLDYLSSLL